MAKEVNKKEANKKENKHFWKDFKTELKKVIWPTPKQLVNNTVAVVTIVIITVVIVFVLDLALESLNTYGIKGLRSAVESTIDETESTDTETDAETSDEQTGETQIVEDSSSNENTVEDQNIVE